MSNEKKLSGLILAVAVIAIGVLAGAAPEGTSRLVSVQQLPRIDDCVYLGRLLGSDPPTRCGRPPQEETLLAELQQRPSSSWPRPAAGTSRQRHRGRATRAVRQDDEGGGISRFPNTAEQLRTTAELRAKGARVPVRTIRDTAPTYSSIAVDVNSNEVIMTDNNLWSYRVFDRLSPTPKNDTDVTPPKRIVTGDQTALQFNNGLYVDPVSGDIYSVESDTGDKMERFAREAQGDQSPISILHTPHRVYNIAADEVKQELFLTDRISAAGNGLRQARRGRGQAAAHESKAMTPGSDAPHGIAVDEKDRLLFVNTWGHHSGLHKSRHRQFVSAGHQSLRAGRERGRQAAARDHRRQDATRLAGRHEVQPGQRRSVHRQ